MKFTHTFFGTKYSILLLQHPPQSRPADFQPFCGFASIHVFLIQNYVDNIVINFLQRLVGIYCLVAGTEGSGTLRWCLLFQYLSQKVSRNVVTVSYCNQLMNNPAELCQVMRPVEVLNQCHSLWLKADYLFPQLNVCLADI